MAWCALCGTAGQHGRYCTRCGGTIEQAPNASDRRDDRSESDQLNDTMPGIPVVSMPPAYGAPPSGSHAYHDVGSEPAMRRPQQRRRSWVLGGSVGLLVTAVALTAVLVVRQQSSIGDEATPSGVAQVPDAPNAVASTAPSASSSAPEERTSASTDSTATAADSAAGAAGGVTVTQTETQLAAVTPPRAAAAQAQPDRMGGARADITCEPGYIVLVASDTDKASFVDRVAELRTLNQMPDGTKWTETQSSCSIFTTQTNAYVLYTGPFANPYDACRTRLASPPDAFIKGTTSGTATEYISCLCPQEHTGLPDITTVAQQGVWVGELQRILGAKLGYDVGSINADPSAGVASRWGIYTPETAAAVGRFQSDNNLPMTQHVDAVTWAALKAAQC